MARGLLYRGMLVSAMGFLLAVCAANASDHEVIPDSQLAVVSAGWTENKDCGPKTKCREATYPETDCAIHPDTELVCWRAEHKEVKYCEKPDTQFRCKHDPANMITCSAYVFYWRFETDCVRTCIPNNYHSELAIDRIAQCRSQIK